MIESVSIADLALALEKGRAVLLDTRAPGAFAAGHIPGSVAVALLDLPAHLRDPDVRLHRRLCDNPELIALVADDDQIAAAAVMLGEVGIRARLVRGGVGAWSRSGRPVNLGVGFGGSPSASS